MQTKPAAQLSLEAILKQNKAEAERLQAAAIAKLAENARIEAEMQKVLSEPPASRLVEAYKNGATMGRMAEENAQTVPPAPVSQRMLAEREVLYAALAITRSWKRRHKKNWHQQERELMAAVEKLSWEP